jgi:glutamyl/glutaminyl-tRNA synthetase
MHAESKARNFIGSIDVRPRKRPFQPVSRAFPPEPNGYLHIGSPSPSALNFGTGAKYGGICN